MLNEFIFTTVMVGIIAVVSIIFNVLYEINKRKILKNFGDVLKHLDNLNKTIFFSDTKHNLLNTLDKLIMDSVSYELKQLKYINTGKYYSSEDLVELSHVIFNRVDMYMTDDFLKICYVIINENSFNDYLVRRIYLILLDVIRELNKKSRGGALDNTVGVPNVSQVDG